MTEASAEAAISQALAAWAEPSCTTVRPYFAGWISDAAAPEDGGNTVSWVSDWRERNWSAAVPGNTDLQYKGTNGDWAIAEADVYLNATDYDWSAEAEAPLDLAAVLTHELGHALGLLHPCEPDGSDGAPVCSASEGGPDGATMYPLYDAAQATLAADDIEGICYLYPEPTDACGGCGRLEMCMGTECHAICGEAVCELGEVCGFWGCVPEGACRDRECGGQSCDSDAMCGPLARCVAGACQSGARAWGSRCESSPECDTGACVDGVCQPLCQGDAECGPNGSCSAAVDGPARGCEDSGAYGFGLTCAAGEDCASGLCVFTEAGSSCTKACKSPAACPDGWGCETVDAREVCVPHVVKADGGCSVSRGNQPRAGLELLGVVLPLVAAARRRRRKRSGDGK